MTDIKLRDYQTHTVQQTYQRFSEGFNKVMVTLATGGGKSIIIAKMAHDFTSKRNQDVNDARTALKRGNKALIIVNRTKLAFQLQTTLKKAFNINCGMIVANSKPNYNKYTCFIAMAQTLSNRDLPEDIGLMMIDEAHEGVFFDIISKCYDKYLGKVWSLGKCFVVGLTATPWRTNKKEGFCRFFDAKVSVTSPLQLIENGYLTPGEMLSYAFENEDMLQTDQGDYTISSLTKAFSEGYAEDVVDKHKQLCRNKKTIAFTPSVKTAILLKDKFVNQGYRSEVITGKDSISTRDDLYKRFADGDIEVLVSVSTLTTGFDEPSIECVLIARPTKSTALLVQMMGRGLRLHEGKKSCLIIDCAGCFHRIKKVQGMKIVNHLDISYSRLCPVSSKPSGNGLIKACPHCETILNQFAKYCHECGAEFKKIAKEKPSSVSFPELEKYMTESMMVERHWIFTQVRQCFKKSKNPSDLMSKFNKKFRHLPNKDYFLHSVFGGDQSLLAQQIYREHLQQFYCDRYDLVRFFSDLEFGAVDREYVIGLNHLYERIFYLDLEFSYDLEAIKNYDDNQWKEFYIEETKKGTSPLTLAILRR